jgi:hypothetical protein
MTKWSSFSGRCVSFLRIIGGTYGLRSLLPSYTLGRKPARLADNVREKVYKRLHVENTHIYMDRNVLCKENYMKVIVQNAVGSFF